MSALVAVTVIPPSVTSIVAPLTSATPSEEIVTEPVVAVKVELLYEISVFFPTLISLPLTATSVP